MTNEPSEMKDSLRQDFRGHLLNTLGDSVTVSISVSQIGL
jgi:hypothetical protein